MSVVSLLAGVQELNDKESQLMRLEADLRATESELNNRWDGMTPLPIDT